MALLVSDRALLERIVNHVFLPPQLPQKEDGADIDHRLLKVTSNALKDFASDLSRDAAARNAAARASAGVSKAIVCHNQTTGAITETEVLSCLEFLDINESIPLRVRAQNAGLLITKTAHDVRFEAFELAAQNKDVLGTSGGLIRHFSGTAVSISMSTFKSPQFRASLAQALATMSNQQAPDTCPQVRKAGKMVDEERDTIHPGVVSELLVSGLIGAYGEPADEVTTTTICKRTRDDVLWDDAELPFRRSPTWLLLRVSLQLIMTRATVNQSDSAYKSFMAVFLAQLLETAGVLDVAIDLQYAMSCKVARRLQKMGASAPKGVRESLQQFQRRCNTRWLNVQAAEPSSCHNLQHLTGLQFERDSRIALPELDDYLERRSFRTMSTKSGAFDPKPEIDGDLSDAFPSLPPLDSPEPYRIASLKKFEHWSQTYLNRFTLAGDVDEVCSKLASAILAYHEFALSVYDAREKSEAKTYGQCRNPEGMSCMVLVILELWVALDKCALRRCSLLGQHDPYIPVQALQNLLLPLSEQMVRLAGVEDYLMKRQAGVEFTSKTNTFGNPKDKHCFAVQYFDNAEDLAMRDMLLHYAQLGEAHSRKRLRNCVRRS